MVDPTVEPLAKRSTWQLALGVGLLVGFLVVALGLWLGANRMYEANIAGFARAPVGCDTTLNFDRTGEFVLYIETTGELDVVRGDCDASGVYDRTGESPAVQLVLRGPSGEVVELESSTGLDYDTGDFTGNSDRRVQIEVSGDHVLTVGPVEGAEFAIAIGRDPDDGVWLMRWGSIGAAIVGFVMGGLFLVLGSRRTVARDVEPSPWQPTAPSGPEVAEWPSGPPGFPAPPPTTGAAGVGSTPAVRPLPLPDFRPVSPPSVASPDSDPRDEQSSPWAPPRD
ncbi:MAG: hypothetical protein GXP35_12770 [Actinobacteria bacterium]|nr:hypothetical protein [Actinomycetota bacterium]